MPADALEVQVKDTWGTLTPTTSFTATGAEKTVRSYGLVPGQQHHIWVIVVDDTAARNQRAATAALIDMPGAPTPCSCALTCTASQESKRVLLTYHELACCTRFLNWSIQQGIHAISHTQVEFVI